MFCMKCGNQVDDNTAFCPACGNPMNPGAAQQQPYQQQGGYQQQPYQQQGGFQQQPYQPQGGFQPQGGYQQPYPGGFQPQGGYQQPIRKRKNINEVWHMIQIWGIGFGAATLCIINGILMLTGMSYLPYAFGFEGPWHITLVRVAVGCAFLVAGGMAIMIRFRIAKFQRDAIDQQKMYLIGTTVLHGAAILLTILTALVSGYRNVINIGTIVWFAISASVFVGVIVLNNRWYEPIRHMFRN